MYSLIKKKKKTPYCVQKRFNKAVFFFLIISNESVIKLKKIIIQQYCFKNTNQE